MHPLSLPSENISFHGVENGFIRNNWVNIRVKSSEQCYGFRSNNMKASGEKGCDVSLMFWGKILISEAATRGVL